MWKIPSLTDPVKPLPLAVAVGICWIAAIIPLGFITHPPLQDYPFHIARMAVLTQYHTNPLLQHLYEEPDFLLPNVGMDVIMLALGALLPLDVAGRIFVAILWLLILTGSVFLHWTIHKRLALWPLLVAALLYNGIFFFGFLNFLLGIGFMLWAFGLWIMLADAPTWRRLLVGAVCALLLFFSHLSAFGIFALGVFGFELQRMLRHGRGSGKELVSASILMIGTFLVPILLFALSRTGANVEAAVAFHLHRKIFAWVTLLSSNWYLDLATAPLLLLLLVQLIQRKLLIDRRLFASLALVIAAFLAMPEQLMTTYWAATRLFVPIVFLLIACSLPKENGLFSRPWVTAALAVFVLYRALVLSVEWRSHDQHLAELIEAFEGLPEGSVVLSSTATERWPPSHLTQRDRWHPPIWHWGNLSVLHGNALAPQMFARPGQQPVVYSASYRNTGIHELSDPIPLAVAKNWIDYRVIDSLFYQLELEDQPAFILVLNSVTHEELQGPRTSLIAQGAKFSLWKLEITKNGEYPVQPLFDLLGTMDSNILRPYTVRHIKERNHAQ